ncbi:MAG: NAD(+)/NADH kinase, partial [Porcipelethomonas sp.]
MKAAIYPNFQKNNALECARNLCDILEDNSFDIFVDDSYRNEFKDKSSVKFGNFDDFAGEADFAIAIGGDGTILKCAKHLVGTDTKLF